MILFYPIMVPIKHLLLFSLKSTTPRPHKYKKIIYEDGELP